MAKQVRQEILGQGNEANTWYLHMLAVLPEYQGKGIGKALVRYVTDIVLLWNYASDIQSDRDGTRCYLVTSIYEPNVAIYERLGFTLMRTAYLKVDGLEFPVSILNARLNVVLLHAPRPANAMSPTA